MEAFSSFSTSEARRRLTRWREKKRSIETCQNIFGSFCVHCADAYILGEVRRRPGGSLNRVSVPLDCVSQDHVEGDGQVLTAQFHRRTPSPLSLLPFTKFPEEFSPFSKSGATVCIFFTVESIRLIYYVFSNVLAVSRFSWIFHSMQMNFYLSIDSIFIEKLRKIVRKCFDSIYFD